MRRRIFRVVKYAALALLAFAALAYSAFAYGFGIPCMFHAVTGLACPGCGGWRMCIAALQGDFSAAFAFNPALFLTAPLFAVLAGSMLYSYIKTGNTRFCKWQNALCIFLVIVFLAFGILRNILWPLP